MIRALAVTLLALGGFAWAEDSGNALLDPYLTTVVGAPPALRAHVPDVRFTTRKLPREPGRKIPPAFWYAARLDYSFAKQKGPAPLMFVIAGTGSAHDSELTRFLMRAFYAAGFHVVGITSPTYSTFVIAASSTSVPGEQRHDAQDLYVVMQKIWAEIGPDLQVTSFDLTGYSLGATNAAFVSLLDEQAKVFNFEKVLMLDPTVRLYPSISKIDRFLENIPGGIDNFDRTFRRIVDRVGRVYQPANVATFSPDLIYAALREDPPRDEELIALIGVAFRLAASATIFSADVMTDFGLIKPANVVLAPTTSLDDYAQVAFRVGLTDYFHAFMWPYFEMHGLTPATTVEEFAALQNLASIRDYLGSASKIGVVSNRDDVILGDGDIRFLTDTFGARAKIYPHGGHLGNLEQREVIQYMFDFFARRPDAPATNAGR